MIISAIESNPILLKFVSLALAVVIVGFFLRMLKQSHVIIYIITGVVIGPYVLGLVTDADLISFLGSFGLLLLLFFIGMEISLHKLVANWKVSVIGTVIQIFFSIAGVWFIGNYLDWSLARIITLGFVISLSSTAVIVKLLQESGEINDPVGQNVLGILLVQDVLIAPMLIILNAMSGTPSSTSEVVLQIIGGLLITGLVILIINKRELKLPFHKVLQQDKEIQVFMAFGLCFGFSVLTGFFGLSTALGAFFAGILINASKSTEWFHDSLYSLKVIFVAMFFISIGMLIDIHFLWNNLLTIGLLVLVVFVTNNLINTIIMRGFKMNWKDSFHAGALLSQVGEFSFVLGSLAFMNEIINEFGYQLIVSVISLSLLFSPIWIKTSRIVIGRLFKNETL